MRYKEISEYKNDLLGGKTSEEIIRECKKTSLEKVRKMTREEIIEELKKEYDRHGISFDSAS